jgi:hypothetical protein
MPTAVLYSAYVPPVKTDRRGAAETYPHFVFGEALGYPSEVLTCLLEGVQHGCEQWLDTWQRAAQPGFVLFCRSLSSSASSLKSGARKPRLEHGDRSELPT